MGSQFLRCCEDLLMIFSRKVFWGATRPRRPPAMMNSIHFQGDNNNTHKLNENAVSVSADAMMLLMFFVVGRNFTFFHFISSPLLKAVVNLLLIEKVSLLVPACKKEPGGKPSPRRGTSFTCKCKLVFTAGINYEWMNWWWGWRRWFLCNELNLTHISKKILRQSTSAV